MNRVLEFLKRTPATFTVALLSAAAQLPLFHRTLVSLDEGQVTAIGHRLTQGEILYRDIYTGIFPGIYWLAEALFRVFGTDVLVLREAQLVVNAATAACLFALARRLGCGRAAWAVPMAFHVLLVLSFPVFAMLAYASLSLLFALVAVLFACRYVGGGRTIDGVATGVALALCTIFKQNFGGLTLLAVLGAMVWARRNDRLGEQSLARGLAVPVLSGLFVAAAMALRIVATDAWPAFFESTFLTLFHSQMAAFDQPVPPVFGAHPLNDGSFLFLYGPGGLFGSMLRGDPLSSPALLSAVIRLAYGSAYLALVLAPLLFLVSSRFTDRRVRTTAQVVMPFTLFFFLGLFPSAIWSHLALVYPPLLLVFAAAGSWGINALQSYSKFGPALATGMRRAAWAAVVVAAVYGARTELNLHRDFAEPMMLENATLRVNRRDARLYRAADDFLRQCAAEDEPILVLPDMPLLYVTSGRKNPTPYDLIIPGDVREDVILERMQKAGVRCIVFNSKMYIQFSGFDRLFPRLDAWLRDEFDLARSIAFQGAEWRFLRKKVTPS